MKKRKKPRNQRQPRTNPLGHIEKQLIVADDLMAERAWGEALAVLEPLAQRHPARPDILSFLAVVYHHLNDPVNLLVTAEDLYRLEPQEPDTVLMLANAYLQNGFMALAIDKLARFAERWPDHPQAEQCREQADQAERKLAQELARLGLPDADGVEVARLNEQIQIQLIRQRYTEVHRLADQLLARQPQFAPALNNSGEAFFRQGKLDEAIARANQVLAFAPDNYHALSNLTRYQFLAGRLDEARATAERLRQAASSQADVWVKKAEALSLLGDDQGVLDIWQGAKAAQQDQESGHAALLHHLAAVAAWRLGQERQARQLWRQALDISPGFELAVTNLQDLDKPPGERHGPWAFDLSHWLSPQLVAQMRTFFKSASKSSNKVGPQVELFLADKPALRVLLPVLLERGSPEARALALRLAMLADSPEARAALRDFALSQNGSDAMRLEAAQAACQAGLLQAGQEVRMWVRGEWQDILLLGWEIYYEPEYQHPPAVSKLNESAGLALRRGDARSAEEFLRKALALKADAPDLLNNLAKALEMQGRNQESRDLIQQVWDRFPDYFFGQIAQARIHVTKGDLDQARGIVKPLLARPRLHLSEFVALCTLEIDLQLVSGQRQGAKSWLSMWEKLDPDHPDLGYFRDRVSGNLLKRLLMPWR